MRNGYMVDVLTSVDIQEIIKIGGKVIESYEGVFYRRNFKITPLRKVIEKLFNLRQKYKGESNDLMQSVCIIMTNILYGVQIGKDFNESCICVSEHWMEIENDDNALVYWRLPNEKYVLKLKRDNGLEGDNRVQNTLPSCLGAFILFDSK